MPTSCKYSKHAYQIQLVILQNVFSSLKNLLSYIWFYFLLVKFHIQFQSAIFLLQIAYHENERDIMYQTFSSKMVSIYLFLRRHFLKIQKMILIQKGRFSKKKEGKNYRQWKIIKKKGFQQAIHTDISKNICETNCQTSFPPIFWYLFILCTICSKMQPKFRKVE